MIRFYIRNFCRASITAFFAADIVFAIAVISVCPVTIVVDVVVIVRLSR